MHRSLIIAVVLLGCTLTDSAPARELSVPVEICGANQAILVRVGINGKDRTFMVDTGAARTVVDARVLGVAEIALRLARFRNRGPGLSGEALDAEIETLRLGDAVWPNRVVVVMNLEGLTEVYRRRIDGLLGQDILREFDRVAFDFKNLQMTLAR